jgi:chromate transporter
VDRIHAGSGLAGPSWQRRKQAIGWLAYLLAGAAAAATVGPWLVLVLLGCGLIELAMQLAAGRRDPGNRRDTGSVPGVVALPMLAAGAVGGGVLLRSATTTG